MTDARKLLTVPTEEDTETEGTAQANGFAGYVVKERLNVSSVRR